MMSLLLCAICRCHCCCYADAHRYADAALMPPPPLRFYDITLVSLFTAMLLTRRR